MLERYPRRDGWRRDDSWLAPGLASEADGHASGWVNRTVFVISTRLMADAPDGSRDVIAQWHLTCSEAGERPSGRTLEQVRRAFGMEEADIDNHAPGVAVHLWMPVDPARRHACHCKEEERVVVDPDGYRWTTPVDGPCRGCAYETSFGLPCTLHRPEARRLHDLRRSARPV